MFLPFLPRAQPLGSYWKKEITYTMMATMARLSLSDRVSSLAIQKELRVKPLLLHIKRRQVV